MHCATIQHFAFGLYFVPVHLHTADLAYCHLCSGGTGGSAEDLRQLYDAAAAAVDTAVAASVGSEAALGGREAEAACQEAVEKLKRLGEQSVTISLLSETGLGLKVKALSKTSNSAIKRAAKSVIEQWKAQVVQQRDG